MLFETLHLDISITRAILFCVLTEHSSDYKAMVCLSMFVLWHSPVTFWHKNKPNVLMQVKKIFTKPWRQLERGFLCAGCREWEQMVTAFL